jgi:acyl-CoA thioester hydrolase
LAAGARPATLQGVLTQEPFAVHIAVRGYELDSHGHVNRAVYLQYAEHARWEYLRAAGVEQARLLAAGVGPVTLQETINYHRELRAGDEITVSCAVAWGDGRTRELSAYRSIEARLLAAARLSSAAR